MRQRKLIGIFLALALAGCAGGGSSSENNSATVVASADSSVSDATSVAVASSGQSVVGTISYSAVPASSTSAVTTTSGTTAAGTTTANTTASQTTTTPSTASSTTPTPTVTNPPTISGSAIGTVVVGTAFSFQPTVKAAGGTGLSFSIVNCPAWATFNATNGELSGTPVVADVGTFSKITISVSDAGGSASLSPFSVAVVETTTGSATLSWVPPKENTNGTPVSDLAGFHLYYGNKATSLTQMVDVKDPTMSSHTVSNLPQGTWYFSVTAYSTANVEGVASDTVSKVIL